jgi:hypothetical protein
MDDLSEFTSHCDLSPMWFWKSAKKVVKVARNLVCKNTPLTSKKSVTDTSRVFCDPRLGQLIDSEGVQMETIRTVKINGNIVHKGANRTGNDWCRGGPMPWCTSFAIEAWWNGKLYHTWTSEYIHAYCCSKNNRKNWRKSWSNWIRFAWSMRNIRK